MHNHGLINYIFHF